jgi:gamma-glutamylcyclotransferase (GGCT)/AIG2-like uncharacterized protein YtfP
MKFYGNQEDDLPLDQTEEERIQEAQTKMGSRTAFFYGKSSDSFHTSPLADIYISTGTLMAKEVLFNVIFGTSTVSRYNIQTVTQTPAILHDHKRSRVKYCDYPGVIPQEGHSVRGTYVTGLTDGDIYRLDMFEGSQYELQTVRVRLLESEGDEAMSLSKTRSGTTLPSERRSWPGGPAVNPRVSVFFKDTEYWNRD